MDGGDSLDDLGRELRERVGHEMRLEAEMVERDAASVEARRRTLSDVAVELLSRGDTVTVIAGERSIQGQLSYARGEIVSLDTTSGSIDAHLAAGVVLRIDERSPEGGRAPKAGSASLRARLLEHELSEAGIEAWVPAHALVVAGSIAAVGKDHVIIRNHDDTEWTLGLRDIAWIRAL